MDKIFKAVGIYSDKERVVVACFAHRDDAERFIRQNNDEVQADELELEEIVCVDDHGVPVSRSDYLGLIWS